MQGRFFDESCQPESPYNNCAFLLIRPTAESIFRDQRIKVPHEFTRLLSGTSETPLCLRGRTTGTMRIALQQMLACGLKGEIARFHLEAKALEIVALRFGQLGMPMAARPPMKLTRKDIEALDQARSILMQQHEHPVSISSLANTVGINRAKLKRGFSQRFGSTVFAFVRS